MAATLNDLSISHLSAELGGACLYIAMIINPAVLRSFVQVDLVKDRKIDAEEASEYARSQGELNEAFSLLIRFLK